MLMRRLSILFLLVAVLASSALSQKRFTPELLWQLGRVGGISVSPDGGAILYQVTRYDIKANKGNTDLYLVPTKGGNPLQLTTSPSGDWNGCWSPDGKRIAFLSTRAGKPQVFVINVDGGEARQLTDMENGCSFLSWSPDGKYLAFCSDVKLEKTLHERYPDLPEANAMIFDDLMIRHWTEWKDEKYRHLFIMPVDGGEPRDLMPGEKYETPLKPFGGGSQIGWSPDGTEIAYTSKKVPDYEWSTDSDIYLVDIATGKTRNITDGMDGFDKDPLYSPDGKWIAFHSMERPGFEADRNRLMLYNRRTGDIIELSKTLDQWVGNTVWAPDSKSLYFQAGDKGTEQLYRISVPGGKWTKLTNGPYNYDVGLDITPDGKTLVVGRRSMSYPTEVYTVSASSGEPAQVTFENKEIYDGLELGEVRERWITSADGAKVQCWVIYPPGFDPSKKYPMLTYCQGGPQATISQWFSYRWNFQLMAANGYIVLCPNRRGLPGFGQDWNDAISKDWGGKAMDDILAATDDMMKEPYVDTKHVAAIGASAGGYAVFWLAGHHQGRFCAFVSHCGVFDLISMYGSTEELWFPNWDIAGGPYWESKKIREGFERNSPHNYVQNWDTPILIISGQKDFRVPVTQSMEAFTAAQVKGIPSRFLYYPDEGHWILGVQNGLLWHRVFFEWLDRWCKEK